ncbi:MAG: PIN domain-containing protein [Rhodocyclaceae bacterium]|nr:PIN domain-containing protein [Rhodocyclaceae bacterium]
MIAVDTNLLVYAHREDTPFHEQAFACIASLANDPAPWAIPWPCLHEFFAIVTHPRIYAPPTPLDIALDQIDAWLESPSLVLLSESDLHWPELRRLIAQGHLAGPQVHDARIAALCQQHGVKKLWTADRDFSRFPRLICVNPLVAAENPS